MPLKTILPGCGSTATVGGEPSAADGHYPIFAVFTGIAQTAPEAEAIVLLGVDQPRPHEIVAETVASHLDSGALITSPRRNGRGGHPIVFSPALRDELNAITEEGQGIRQVFQAHRGEVNEIEIDDPVIHLDLNTVEAYEQARALYDA